MNGRFCLDLNSSVTSTDLDTLLLLTTGKYSALVHKKNLKSLKLGCIISFLSSLVFKWSEVPENYRSILFTDSCLTDFFPFEI